MSFDAWDVPDGAEVLWLRGRSCRWRLTITNFLQPRKSRTKKRGTLVACRRRRYQQKDNGVPETRRPIGSADFADVCGTLKWLFVKLFRLEIPRYAVRFPLCPAGYWVLLSD